MGNLIKAKSADADVLLLGLKGAGKTHMLINSYVEEDWQGHYLKGPGETDDNPENKRRHEETGTGAKYVALLPTQGFNNELYEERISYRIWDIGGSSIYGGEVGSEFFSSGTDFGLVPYLRTIEVHGIIWVVNVSMDIEYLHRSK